MLGLPESQRRRVLFRGAAGKLALKQTISSSSQDNAALKNIVIFVLRVHVPCDKRNAMRNLMVGPTKRPL